MAYGRIYKTLLCCAVAVSVQLVAVQLALLYRYHLPEHVIVAFIAYMAAAIIFIPTLAWAWARDSVQAHLLCILLSVFKLLCAIALCATLVTEYATRGPTDDSDAFRWIRNHKYFSIGLAVLCLLLFVCELFVLNRGYSAVQARRESNASKAAVQRL